MSLDDRLRQGLDHAAGLAVIDPEADRTAAVRRGRARRRQQHVTRASALAVVALGASLGFWRLAAGGDGDGGTTIAGPATTATAPTAPTVADIPMVACTGSFTGQLEHWTSDSGAPTVREALDRYFQESAPTWASVPEIPAELPPATADAVARGGWVQTGSPRDNAVFANLVANGEIVARFQVHRLDDDAWRVELFDYCHKASDAGLVLRSDS